MKTPGRDISVHVAYLDLHLAIVGQGVAWAPDVADDMVTRMGRLFDQSLYSLAEYGLMDTGDQDDDEFGPLPERELIDPRTVYVEDEFNG